MEWQEELKNMLKELGVAVAGLNAFKESQEKAQAELKAMEAARQRPEFVVGEAAKTETMSFINKYLGWDVSKQGLKIMDQMYRAGKKRQTYIKDTKTRDELAKYYALMIGAGVMRDAVCQMKFREEYAELYRRPDTIIKTALGDTGNVYPVPDVVEAEILRFATEESLFLQRGNVVPLGPGKRSYPVGDTSVSVTWASTAASSDPTITEVELDPKEVGAYTTVRNYTLMDANYDIVSWLTELFAEAMGLEIDYQCQRGTGNPLSGILTAACGKSVTFGVGSTAFSNVTADDLSAMIAELDGKRKNGAIFVMHGSVLHYVRILKDADGRPIFYQIPGPNPASIYGYEYVENTKMIETSAAATAFMWFGNPRYMLVGRRAGDSALMVDPFGLFLENKTRFKLYNRWDMEMGLPNAFVRLLTHS